MTVSKSCPIEYKTVDKNIIRVNAMIVFSFLVLFVVSFNPAYLIMIGIDFIIRVFFGLKYSPICFVIKRILRLSGVKPHKINAGPKTFAAKVGLLFSILSLGTYILGWENLSLGIVVVFMIATGLEAFLNYCLACQIYPYYKKLLG